MIQQAAECISTNQPLYQAFYRLCQSDRLLRDKIQSFQIIPNNYVEILVQPNHLESICKKLFKIAQLITQISNLQYIKLNEFRFDLKKLLRLQPGLCKYEGIHDRRSQMEQINQNAQRYRALLGYTTCNATVMIISTSGIYKDVHIQQGSVSKIPADQMLNCSMDEVLPVQTAFYVLQQIKEAYAANQERQIYWWWDEACRSQIIPIAGSEEVVLVCIRA